MPEDTGTGDATSQDDGQQSDASSGGDNPQTLTQAEIDAIVEKRLARERSKFADYDDLRKKAEQFDELEESKKTELEKVMSRAEAAEAEKARLESENLRFRVGTQKGLTPEQMEFLSGDSEEELIAKADKLLAMVGPDSGDGRAPAPRPDLSQGGSGSSTALNGDPLLNDLKSKLGIP